MKNEKGFVEVLAVIGVLALAFFAVFLLFSWSEKNADKKCKAQFGTEWTGKSPAYNPDMCINSKGEVKYPI